MARDIADRWAVFRASALGDVTLTTGVLAWWNRAFDARFTFITRSTLAPLLQNHPAVDEVVAVHQDEFEGGEWWSKSGRIATDLSGMGLIDLHLSLRSLALSLRWDGPVRSYAKYGVMRRLYHRFGWDFLERRLSSLNVPQRYALALTTKAPDISEVRPLIRLTESEQAQASDHLMHLGLTRPLVALHPFATHPDKAWPMGYWLSLIPLIERAGLDWIILGKNPDHLQALDDPRNLTGRTSLRETCALMSRCRALVTADSGPMHLATAVGTPVVALFGPTAKAWGFHPSGPFDTVIERELPCRPCSLHGSTVCKRGRECLTSIEPEEVAVTLFRTLERAGW